MKSVMTHQFSQVPRVEMQRSSFQRNHGYKTTFDADFLIPIFLDEVLPGDTFNLKMDGFARLATPIFPVMDNMFMDTFFFFVPYRLVWSDWQRFCGERDNPDDSIDYLIPQCEIDAADATVGSLVDYFGLPIGVDQTVSALPFRAHNLIYNEWFRDQNLQISQTVPLSTGPDTYGPLYTIYRRGKRHDYFTSCLPWPQKGDSVALPLGADAPVYGIGMGNTNYVEALVSAFETGGTVSTTYANARTASGSGGLNETLYIEEDPNNTGFPNIYTDLSDATASTINQLRQAFQLQRLLEKDARGGTRYTEIIRNHFQVTSPDGRLQRPEYLGGGNSMINISPVAQTSNDGANGSVGQLGALGTASLNGHGFSKSFTEHGLIIGYVNVRADLTYQQRIDRSWSRSTRYDYYWPTLAHLGEQAVLSKEIYYDNTAGDEDVFGYQERFAEYRYKPSNITGLFRSAATGNLDEWHLSQQFTSRPLLNATFITSDTPVDRVIETPTEPHFIFDSYFNLKCARPMPLYSVPGLIDHF